MLDLKEAGLSQDQELLLHGKIIEFVREALVYNKGYVVLEFADDIDTFDFNIYYSNGSTIAVKYEETRSETLERILFTIDCKELRMRENTGERINDIIKHLYVNIVGKLSQRILLERHKLKDASSVFKEA